MSKTNIKTLKRQSRHRRVRARVIGTSERPRLAVFRSNTRFTAQVIDDTKGMTLASISSYGMQGATSLEKAVAAAKALAADCVKKGITQVVFDRGGYLYVGTVKAFADAAREGGLIF